MGSVFAMNKPKQLEWHKETRNKQTKPMWSKNGSDEGKKLWGES